VVAVAVAIMRLEPQVALVVEGEIEMLGLLFLLEEQEILLTLLQIKVLLVEQAEVVRVHSEQVVVAVDLAILGQLQLLPIKVVMVAMELQIQ
jgi:hypothetical protein|tara:strand:+ start:230 stop:505 length:276 start_codon:yes stop_codon:yes gene_type:complete